MAENPLQDQAPPPLKHVYYLLPHGTKSEEFWKNCVEKLTHWKTKRSSTVANEAMSKYKKQRALNLVWVGGQLSGDLPDDLDEKHTFQVLGKIYDDIDSDKDNPTDRKMENDADKDRKSFQQLTQHMKALKLLCYGDLKAPLTASLIKHIHGVLMNKLNDAKGQPILAGEYRDGPVHAGDHAFPSSEVVPRGMERIVEEYNKKFSSDHDMYSLASWLLYKFVTLHPFQDGNGRMCRLLWCYSLMRDGLPFPVTISSGYKKAHKHYVNQIEADRRNIFCEEQPSLTTLTVFAISRAWTNFYDNLKFELTEEEYALVTEGF